MTGEVRRKVTAPLLLCAVCMLAGAGRCEDRDQSLLVWWVLSSGSGGEECSDRNCCVQSGGALELSGTGHSLPGLPVPLQGEPCSAGTAVRPLIQHLTVKANGITIYVPGLMWECLSLLFLPDSPYCSKHFP